MSVDILLKLFFCLIAKNVGTLGTESESQPLWAKPDMLELNWHGASLASWALFHSSKMMSDFLFCVKWNWVLVQRFCMRHTLLPPVTIINKEIPNLCVVFSLVIFYQTSYKSNAKIVNWYLQTVDTLKLPTPFATTPPALAFHTLSYRKLHQEGTVNKSAPPGFKHAIFSSACPKLNWARWFPSRKVKNNQTMADKLRN